MVNESMVTRILTDMLGAKDELSPEELESWKSAEEYGRILIRIMEGQRTAKQKAMGVWYVDTEEIDHAAENYLKAAVRGYQEGFESGRKVPV